MFRKVLVANRGEIALRVIRACRELRISTVAVFSTADRDSMHVRLADESVCIGPPPPAQSYNYIARLISAAEVTGADAIHPGYGFLSENAHFAEVCDSCGFTFIAPTPEMIRKMGDKAVARRTMKDAGLPCVPASEGVLPSVDEAQSLATTIGSPVILKAAAGGGGRGRVAAGERLALKQEDVEWRGHAIECRINAEDHEHAFRPSPGVITYFYKPGGPGLRLDSHAYAGYTVPPYYDSMIGKLIARGKDRAEAMRRMEIALEEIIVEGIKTTIPFHRLALPDPSFRAGDLHTHFVQKLFK